MTTIAWDGKRLATDSMVTAGDLVMSRNSKKLYRHKDMWFACTGTAGDCEAFRLWMISGEDPRKKPKVEDFTAIVVRGGKAVIYEAQLTPFPVTGPAAAGSGREIAMGCMLMGATAKEAVRAACRLNVYTGGRIQVSK